MSKQKYTMMVELSAVMAQDVIFYEIARKHLIKGLAEKSVEKYKEKLAEKIPPTYYGKTILSMMIEDFKRRFKDENYYPQMKMEYNSKDINSIIVSAEFEESEDEFFYKWSNKYEEENVKNG